jgi:hypothetical protein
MAWFRRLLEKTSDRFARCATFRQTGRRHLGRHLRAVRWSNLVSATPGFNSWWTGTADTRLRTLLTLPMDYRRPIRPKVEIPIASSQNCNCRDRRFAGRGSNHAHRNVRRGRHRRIIRSYFHACRHNGGQTGRRAQPGAVVRSEISLKRACPGRLASSPGAPSRLSGSIETEIGGRS